MKNALTQDARPVQLCLFEGLSDCGFNDSNQCTFCNSTPLLSTIATEDEPFDDDSLVVALSPWG